MDVSYSWDIEILALYRHLIPSEGASLVSGQQGQLQRGEPGPGLSDLTYRA